MKAVCQAIDAVGGRIQSTYALRHIMARFSTRYTYRAVERCIRHGYVRRGSDGHALILTLKGLAYCDWR